MATFNEAQKEIAEQINKQFSWYFLAKEVSDYTNCTYFEIMDRPVVEVLSIVMIMQAKMNINRANPVNTNG